MNQEIDAHRIGALDGLRAISVALVILAHLSQNLPVGMLASYGNLGVSIFFFISGYVICLNMVKEESERSAFSVVAFFARRFFRIIPPLLLYVATVGILGYCGLIPTTLTGYVGALTFSCNFRFVNCDWFMGHTWSLAFEEQFYLAFPILCLVARGHTRIKVFVLLLGICLFAGFGQYILKVPNAWINPGHYFSLLCLGVLAGLTNAKVLAQLRRHSTLTFYISVVWLLVYFQLPPNGFLIGAHLLFTPLCIAVIVLSPIAFSNSWFATALRIRPLTFLGRISYGVYLWQQLFIAERSLYSGVDLSFVWFLLFVPVLLSYYLAERPALTYGKQLSARLLRTS
jgi:peptidoglycan/LPS O-acetylase OafA/YrhL